MKEIQVTTTIRVKDDGGIETEINSIPNSPDEENMLSDTYSESHEITEEEKERQAVVSNLANICEYLTDSEVIKIKLIIAKAEKRRLV